MSSINVPLLDLKAQYATIREECEAAVRDVIETQYFIMGPKVQALEEEIAAYCGTKHAVGCASGSDAILLALWAIDIQPGDEVICPSYTFFATAGSIARLGAKPVYVDIDPDTYNMNIEAVRDAASRCTRLKAIMPVHLYGQSVDMKAFQAIGDEFGVPVIEDAAQAIGAKDQHGAMAGSTGLMGCFSFFPTKNLGGFGDGGIVTTNDDAVADKLKLLRLHGMEPKYYHPLLGMNSRLDALQAAVLSVKLRSLEAWHGQRAGNAEFYTKAFHEAGALDSSTPLASGEGLPIRTPVPAVAPARHVYNQYIIRVPASMRDDLRAHMMENGVGSEIYYPVPLHQQECFSDLGYATGDLPESELASKETIALPIYAELTDEQLGHVTKTIISFVESKAPVGT